MGLQLEIPVSVGTLVYVYIRGERMTGTVRYCLYRENSYFVGIHLEKDTAWSREHLEPAHLLDLQEFALHAGNPGNYVH